MASGSVVAICQYGGEFVSRDDGSMVYTGGEAHALTINRDMPFDDLKSEIASMFNIDSNTISVKYFLPINKRTPITVSNEKDFERMFEFHASSLTIDIYVTIKVENRATRSVAADSGTSIVDTAAADRNVGSRKPSAANKTGKRGRISTADSNIRKVGTGTTADNVKQRKQSAAGKSNCRNAANDSVAAVVTPPTIDINRQERLITTDDVNDNRETSGIMEYPNLPVGFCLDHVENIGLLPSTSTWDTVITEVGQEFDNVKVFRDELCKYAFAKGFRYRYIKNDNARVTVKCCSDNCPWRLHASASARKQKFIIKKINDVHTCGANSEDVRRRAKKQWLAGIIKGKILDNPNLKPREIIRDLAQEYGINLNYTQAWQAKEAAQKEIHMLQQEIHNQLPWLCQKILETNPSSATVLATSMDSKIRRLFVSYYASLHGFEHGCRPLLFLGRVPLKVNNNWKLLVAAAVDADDDIFPVAFGLVEDETPDSWHWFLVQLKYAITASHRITIVSSRQKGLDELVPHVFEDSCHGYSVFHLTEEFKAEIKKGSSSDQVRDAMVDEFKRAAESYLPDDFNACINRIRNASKDAAEWVLSNKPEHWSNAHFRGSRYDHLSSNIVETMSRWISMKDESSVVQMMDALLVKIIEITNLRREALSTWEDTLTPSMEQKLQKEMARARTLNVICSSDTVFEVRGTSVDVVNIGSWECTCRRWQITGLPCVHAIAVLDRVNRSVYDYCSRYFRSESHRLAYSAPIHPMPDVDRIIAFVGTNYPPPTKRPPGRPKRKRINPHKTSIRPLHCSRCKVAGHNKATCEAQL